MKKLRVTWQDGQWIRDGDQKVTTTDIHHQAVVKITGETLGFLEPGSNRVLLIIPENRLISAVPVEAPGDLDA